MKKIRDQQKQIDQLITFSDAILAFAITLLALDLRVDYHETGRVLHFSDFVQLIPKFTAFTLSFIQIAIIWTIYHDMFDLVVKVDTRIIAANLLCLLFVITIPFTASLVSIYFGQVVSSFVYSLNILIVAVCLDYMWDYLESNLHYLQVDIDKEVRRGFRIGCNVSVANGAIAVAVSFFVPFLALAILVSRPVTNYIVKKAKKR